jgi:hypothetical protein
VTRAGPDDTLWTTRERGGGVERDSVCVCVCVCAGERETDEVHAFLGEKRQKDMT